MRVRTEQQRPKDCCSQLLRTSGGTQTRIQTTRTQSRSQRSHTPHRKCAPLTLCASCREMFGCELSRKEAVISDSALGQRIRCSVPYGRLSWCPITPVSHVSHTTHWTIAGSHSQSLPVTHYHSLGCGTLGKLIRSDSSSITVTCFPPRPITPSLSLSRLLQSTHHTQKQQVPRLTAPRFAPYPHYPPRKPRLPDPPDTPHPPIPTHTPRCRIATA